jgi:NADPH:quinone reductase-like Zn-dependent oxidoreductase
VRAPVFRDHGVPAEVLELASLPDPGPPAPDQVLIRVLVRPIHPGDLVGVRGQSGARATGRPTRPITPGVEGMGIVEATGSPGQGPPLGARVAFFPAPGAWAEFVLAPAEFVVEIPDDVSDTTAALMLVNPLTLAMLMRAVEDALRDGRRTVVQTAAGSSIGTLVNAAAHRHGLRLINLVRDPAGAQRLRARFSQTPVVTTSDQDWPDQVRAAADGDVPVVLDAVGGELTADLVALLADGGTLISYGQLGTASTALEALPLTRRELTLRSVSVGRWALLPPEQRAEDLAFATQLARTRPELLAVDATYDLDDLAAALDHVARPGKDGTVLLTNPIPE